ncbi:MAG: response regulator [Firmicutes bacterium]|nr:response regulator [Bacillota bacterium]
MIRVIIVDDELPALKMAESILRIVDDVEICGAFSDQDELLECLPKIDVDLIFLDIKMPGMHGLELAGRVNEIKPEAAIVFATAYDSYAVEAFETEALDYILKPMTEERIRKTLNRYKKRGQELKHRKNSSSISVYSFGRFSVKSEQGERMKFRTAKTEELFAFLMHHQGNVISKEKIMEELWYDRDADRAQAILYTTLYQLRKDLETVGLKNIIQSSRKDGGNCSLSWIPDHWDYHDYVTFFKQHKMGSLNLETIKQAAEIYQDGYLMNNGYLWATGKQAELELSYLELMEHIIDMEVRQQKYDFALFDLKKLSKTFPFSTAIHTRIIAVYLLTNNREAANEHYQKIKKEAELWENIDMDTLILNPFSAFEKA